MTTEPTELFKPYTLSQTLTKQKRAIFVVKFSSIGHLLVSSSVDKALHTYTFTNSDSESSNRYYC
ncbi:hypothetical protein AHAS_Ahas01G0169600 [Arachis hypogaea]